ncbi:type II toxin-antitoxin system RelB/DinJ family antitoxin [Patescibacteria group bacterium]|nr:type II toxin-antitoxin system RelB/DinJ family antitoxin [Patescibacteria group bacterium]MBU1703148.1 type II toxin-antitoxin system RelB/DinJ family antitoxin [Patescibacteria group bacterium]MBU1953645.1 type II toxin-antitoxin system RelB/DinJ family antitoxin [Patescibacteria group bacterium]
MSSKTAMIRARTTPKLKKEAEEILGKLGIKPTDAINIFYTQIVINKGIPFNIRLEESDKEENYIKVKDAKHLKELIGLKDE